MTQPAPDYTPLWTWVRERERVRVLKDSGAPQPWTDDPVIATYRFCTLTVTGTWSSGGGWFQPNEVTHWMPLPAPPTPTDAA